MMRLILCPVCKLCLVGCFFAVATGIIYSRFSKPTARLLFSDCALISPCEDGEALMFRVVNRRLNVLMEMEASVLLFMDVGKSEQVSRKFYNLDLETSSITFFSLSWTIVHPFQGTSPIKNIGIEELVKRKAEILILLKGFDETFGQNIRLRFSYTADEIVSNTKFIRNFEVTKNGQIELNIEAVHSFEKL